MKRTRIKIPATQIAMGKIRMPSTQTRITEHGTTMSWSPEWQLTHHQVVE